MNPRGVTRGDFPYTFLIRERGTTAYNDSMRVTSNRSSLAARAWQDLPNLFSLLIFFGVTALLFRSLDFALVVTASLGFHEIGHAGAISWCGLRWRITFGLVGAWTWSPGEERARLSELANVAIHLAGPLFSLLLALMAFSLHQFWQPQDRRLLILANFSAQVGFINLLPFGGLTDGGKVVRRLVNSLDKKKTWLIVVLPVAVTALMLVLYTLVQSPHLSMSQLAPFLLGLLLIGLWLAGSLFLETWMSARRGNKADLPVSQPITPRQAYFIILVTWDFLALLLILISTTPFWLEPQYILGYLKNLFALFGWLFS
jgi:hypothetical protein